MIKHKFVELLMLTTGEAYSRARYGEQAWEKAIVLLFTMGFTTDQVREILMSKYMRWAADAFATQVRGREVLNGEEIVQYHRQWKIDVASLMKEANE